MKHVCKIISSVACAALLFGCSSEAPRSVDALLIDASRDADIGNWQEARTKAEEAYSLQPTNINAGVMYALTLEQNSLSSAIEVLEKVTPNAQGHFMAQFSYGRMLFSRGLNAGGADYFHEHLIHFQKHWRLNRTIYQQ